MVSSVTFERGKPLPDFRVVPLTAVNLAASPSAPPQCDNSTKDPAHFAAEAITTWLRPKGWQDRGFRGPLYAIGKARNRLPQQCLIDRIDAMPPMPEAQALLALLDRIAA